MLRLLRDVKYLILQGTLCRETYLECNCFLTVNQEELTLVIRFRWWSIYVEVFQTTRALRRRDRRQSPKRLAARTRVALATSTTEAVGSNGDRPGGHKRRVEAIFLRTFRSLPDSY